MEAFKHPLENPSFRLRCWYNYQLLKKEGHIARIIETPSEVQDADVLVLMSFGEEEYQLAQYMKSKNRKVIHDYTENIRGIEILEKTKKLCDYIVCCSTYLADEERKVYKDRVTVIRDPLEEFPVTHNVIYERDKLKVVWSGMGGNALLVEAAIKPVIESLGMEYVELSNRPESNILWDKEDWFLHMASCDICICPQDHWAFPAKSNVKVTTAISLGLPVICSPLQSYLEIIEDGKNGYLAFTLEDWGRYLLHLRSPDLRRIFVERIKQKISNFYEVKYIYGQWKTLFR